jgi:UDP-2,4-diacetamido-2,4,6-trideoxy-beta-L-altropyranose hydrolase
MRIAIRVDASVRIGTGHVIRCLTLADRLRSEGAAVHFVCREHPGHLIDLIDRRGFHSDVLPRPLPDSTERGAYEGWVGCDPGEDALQTIARLRTRGGLPWDCLVVDHYGLGLSWERALRPWVRRILAIDDLDREHDADLVLDQNLWPNHATRYSGRVPKHCVKLFGPHYALLRPEYARARVTLGTRGCEVHRILVFFGGADPDDVTSAALEALRDPAFAHLAVDVVVGPANPRRDRLQGLARLLPGAEVYGPLPHLADLMASADLALGAGGTTTWERCCLGLPSLVVTIAENQEGFTRTLHEAGALIWLGTSRSVGAREIRKGLARLIADAGKRREMADRARALTDGNGTQRVADLLLERAAAEDARPPLEANDAGLLLTVVSDGDSWLNEALPRLFADWLEAGHQVRWVHDPGEVPAGDLCFLLGCGQLVPSPVLRRNRNNLVVHESDLPEGKGWSPLTWQIIEGKNRIAVTLFEAAERVDSGPIYLQEWIEFEGHEIIAELREAQARVTFSLCRRFVEQYPAILSQARPQTGRESFYPRRTPEDSRLDPNRSLGEQFPLLRVVDNDRYPAFFDWRGHRYRLKIEKEPPAG